VRTKIGGTVANVRPTRMSGSQGVQERKSGRQTWACNWNQRKDQTKDVGFDQKKGYDAPPRFRRIGRQIGQTQTATKPSRNLVTDGEKKKQRGHAKGRGGLTITTREKGGRKGYAARRAWAKKKKNNRYTNLGPRNSVPLPPVEAQQKAIGASEGGQKNQLIESHEASNNTTQVQAGWRKGVKSHGKKWWLYAAQTDGMAENDFSKGNG